MQLFYQPDISTGNLSLSQEESRHAIKVLRKTRGDIIDVVDGFGSFYNVRITDPNSSQCLFEVISTQKIPAREFRLHIAVAPTKNMDRTEWFVEKAVELGVDEISFALCKTSERKSINLDRVQKIAVSAMKQSQQAWLPTIHPIVDVKNILASSASQKFIAFVDSENPDHLMSVAHPKKDYLILIGPEGDFSKEELQIGIDAGFQKVSLGPTRLRTETAATMACLILNLVNR